MGFLDNLSRSLSTGVDRGKFELEKIQRVARIQGELSDLHRQSDLKLAELGQRAYELLKAGQINSPTLAAIATAYDQLRNSAVGKEEELKRVQAEQFVEPVAPVSSTPPSTPAHSSPAQTPPASSIPIESATRRCPTCGFEAPSTVRFCPSCGSRISV